MINALRQKSFEDKSAKITTNFNKNTKREMKFALGKQERIESNCRFKKIECIK